MPNTARVRVCVKIIMIIYVDIDGAIDFFFRCAIAITR